MMHTAIILAAGRGSRMNSLTAERPKCLLPLAGRPLLEWQTSSLRKAGMKDIHAVLGYLSDRIEGDFHRLHNPRWAETNMVGTLLCAREVLQAGPCIISYSDIAYRPSHVASLAANPEDIAITYDLSWQKLWELRFNNPLSDAETFKQQDGILTEIGKRAESMDDIEGQYMGLIKCTPDGFRTIHEFVMSRPAPVRDRMDMTSLLSGLLEQDVRIGVTAVDGGWVEADNAEDLEKYERQLEKGNFSHDFRW